MSKYRVGTWVYKNGGGSAIQDEITKQLNERDIEVFPDLNLAHAIAQDGHILCKGVEMEALDAFFSYNAGKQSQYQMYLYQTLNDYIPCLNNFDAFALTEDKFRTSHRLNRMGIRTADHVLLNRRDKKKLKKILSGWDNRLVYKPTDGWGGMGIVKIENERALDMLFPFIDQTNIPHFYVERFVNYDMTDYRIDIVDGEYIACYGRKAPKDDWKTNITGGGSVMLREPSDEAVNIALRAAKATGLEIAGVDLIYDLDREEYVVLEVNGIPAFATPEQETLGLDFNQKKITKIVELIERRVHQHNPTFCAA